MEKDDSTDAGLDAVVSGEKQLTVQPSVLLCVLSVYALEALCNAAYGDRRVKRKPVNKIRNSPFG